MQDKQEIESPCLLKGDDGHGQSLDLPLSAIFKPFSNMCQGNGAIAQSSCPSLSSSFQIPDLQS